MLIYLGLYEYWYSYHHKRHAAQAALSKEAVQNFHPILTKEATLLALALLTSLSSCDRTEHFQCVGT
jgi:hypothetical protein